MQISERLPSGERIGWTAVEREVRAQGDPESFVVTIALAKAGEQGANYTDSDNYLYRGLAHVACLRAIISKDDSEETLMKYRSDYGDTKKAADLLRFGIVGGLNDKSVRKEWANNDETLLTNVQEKLVQRGIGNKYPDIYFSLMLALAEDSKADKIYAGSDELFIPDTTMMDITANEVVGMRSVLRALGEYAFSAISVRDRLSSDDSNFSDMMDELGLIHEQLLVMEDQIAKASLMLHSGAFIDLKSKLGLHESSVLYKRAQAGINRGNKKPALRYFHNEIAQAFKRRRYTRLSKNLLISLNHAELIKAGKEPSVEFA